MAEILRISKNGFIYSRRRSKLKKISQPFRGCYFFACGVFLATGATGFTGAVVASVVGF